VTRTDGAGLVDGGAFESSGAAGAGDAEEVKASAPAVAVAEGILGANCGGRDGGSSNPSAGCCCCCTGTAGERGAAAVVDFASDVAAFVVLAGVPPTSASVPAAAADSAAFRGRSATPLLGATCGGDMDCGAALTLARWRLGDARLFTECNECLAVPLMRTTGPTALACRPAGLVAGAEGEAAGLVLGGVEAVGSLGKTSGGTVAEGGVEVALIGLERFTKLWKNEAGALL